MSEELSRKLIEALGLIACNRWGQTGSPFWGWQKNNCGHENCYPENLPPDFLSPAVFSEAFAKWRKTLYWSRAEFSSEIKSTAKTHEWYCVLTFQPSDKIGSIKRKSGTGKTLEAAGLEAWLAALEAGGKKP